MQSPTITDWHTHILPAMDDGSQDTFQAVGQLKLSARQRVTAVALTPHFYPQRESPLQFFRRRDLSLEALEKAISMEEGDTQLALPQRLPGAEVYYFAQLPRLPREDLAKLCIAGTKLIMVEMPGSDWDEDTYNCLEELLYDRKLTPLVAHIDRYYKAIKDLDRLDGLIKDGLLVQMNADALLSFKTRGKALRWIAAGRVHLIGSDCHNLTTRKPNLDQAYTVLKNKMGPSAAENLFKNPWE